jgi:hypothetical protein
MAYTKREFFQGSHAPQSRVREGPQQNGSKERILELLNLEDSSSRTSCAFAIEKIYTGGAARAALGRSSGQFRENFGNQSLHYLIPGTDASRGCGRVIALPRGTNRS